MSFDNAKKIAEGIEILEEIGNLFKEAPPEEIAQLMEDCKVKAMQPHRTPEMVRQAFLLRSGLTLGLILFCQFQFDPNTREFLPVTDA